MWDTDASGNYSHHVLATRIAAAAPRWKRWRPSFQQDLNGDHVIGVPSAAGSTTIEAYGSTALVQTGNNYFLNPVGRRHGP